MMKSDALYPQGNRRQGGAATVEFALVAVLLIVLLLGIVELGRFLYLFNTVQEVTRRAAREAVVSCTDETTQDGIRSRAVLGTGAKGAFLPIGGEVTDARVVIDYLDKDQKLIARYMKCESPYNDNILKCVAGSNECIKFVRVRVCDGYHQQQDRCAPVQYVPMIGLFVPDPNKPIGGMLMLDLRVNIPLSTVIMPAESLGYTFTLP